MQEKFFEEVDYGSCGSSVNPSTDSDHKWSTSENDISSQFMKECKPRMSKSRFQFAVH